eukprot:TRINITY_DN6697_c0_g1_i1.p1 TRINITY_DN6697_c0_g1~~TRINITY_DN6697_c0_g1_i1.p1  ORF type:complete len:202 (-),score=54.46 TRINITY_DN6697_c0_g1_i1:250-855(-)
MGCANGKTVDKQKVDENANNNNNNNNTKSNEPIQLKLLMLGDSGVGKTSLILRYCDNDFTDAVIGVLSEDYKEKKITVEGRNFEIQIFDTAGQERFRKVTSSYFRGGQGVMLCFDLTKRSTFENLTKWKQEIERYGEDGVAIVVVGNKCDLKETQVTKEEAERFAQEWGFGYFQTSAKDGTGVDDAFAHLASQTKDSECSH